MEIPETGRLGGIDFGTVRVGVAICDQTQSIASPLEVYTRRSEKLDAQYFIELARQEAIVGWVIGLPLHMSGDESQKSGQARAFGKWLSDVTASPVVFHDERLTTAHARELLGQASVSGRKKKSKLDKLAAQILLSSFLESSRHARQNRPLDDK